MSNTINHFSSLPYGNHPSQPTSTTAYREASAMNRDALISITTDEGDIVTLSSFEAQAASLSYDSQVSSLGAEKNFTMQSLSAESYGFSVVGDLSEEELQDIKHLMYDLRKIAKEFFSGNTENALGKAMDIGTFDSLSQFSASFSYTMSISTQLSQNHPIPASFNSEMLDRFEGMSELSSLLETEEQKYSDILRAQWQQINDFLATEDDMDEEHEGHREVKEKNESRHGEEKHTFSDRMLDLTRKMTSKHPRLTPFMLPLVEKAIDTSAPPYHDSSLRNSPSGNLQTQFHQKLNDWLISV